MRGALEPHLPLLLLLSQSLLPWAPAMAPAAAEKSTSAIVGGQSKRSIAPPEV